MWEIRLFGATTVRTADRTVASADLGGEKPRQILEILALSAGVPVPKDHLAELLWDGRPPRSYPGTLESYVCVLRRSLGLGRGRGAVLRTVMRGYVLDADEVRVDLLDFRRLARGSAAGVDPGVVLPRLQEALSLADGELLAGDAYETWAVTERETFRRELVDLATTAAIHAAALGEHEAVIPLARRAIAADPLAEAAWYELMEALWRTGRATEALRAYLALKEHLATELGTDPSAASQQLYLQILRDDRADRGREGDAREEVRVLLHLLREAVASLPGLDAPRGDHDLFRFASDLVA